MSYIASFHLLSSANAETAVSLAEKKPRPKRMLGIFPRNVIDAKTEFWAYMQRHATELEAFEYSGFAFVDLLSIYPEFAAAGESALGNRLTVAIGNLYLVFDHEAARRATETLGAEPPDDGVVSRNLAKQNRSNEMDTWREPIRESWKISRPWLAQVTRESTGLLSAG